MSPEDLLTQTALLWHAVIPSTRSSCTCACRAGGSLQTLQAICNLRSSTNLAALLSPSHGTERQQLGTTILLSGIQIPTLVPHGGPESVLWCRAPLNGLASN